MKRSIQTKIVIGFVVVVALIYLINLATSYKMHDWERQAIDAFETHQSTITLAHALVGKTNRLEAELRDYLVAKDPLHLINATAASQEIRLTLEQLEKALADEPEALAIIKNEITPLVNNLDNLAADTRKLDGVSAGDLHAQLFTSLYRAEDGLFNQQISRAAALLGGDVSSIRHAFRVNELIDGIVAIMAVILALFISRSITAPLRVLVQGMRNVSQGRYQEIAGVRTNDELGEVVATFNRMVVTIRSHEEDLQQKNEELQSQGEELAAQNEEIITQQEELHTTLEQLSVHEELLNNLYRFSQSLTQTIELPDLLPIILEGLMREAEAQVGALYLGDNGSGELTLRTSQGLVRTEEIAKWRIGEGLLGQAVERRQITVANYPAGQLRTKSLHGEMGLLSEIYCPIVFHDTLLGVAVVGRTHGRPYDDTYKQQIATLIDQAAVAVHNALTYLDTQKALVRTQEIDKLKSELLSTVSHELRTPLASILGFSELLIKKPPAAAKAQKYLETIYNESVRLTGLVNNFLDLQRIETGRFEFVKKPVDMGELIRSAVEVYQGQGKNEINVHVQDDLPQVLVDPERMVQVLGNLLSNAIKYSPDGGLIEVRACQRGAEYLEVAVRDHGLGIPADDQKKVFQPFFRVDNSDMRKIGGTGLGLAISRKIMRAHGGDIRVHSVCGEGSTFTVSIPLGPVRQEKLAAHLPAEKFAHILIVEDDEALANLISEALHENGYTTRVERDGPGALAAINKEVPAIIILDLILEGPIDGWNVLRQLKNNDATADIPVIISSCLDEKKKGAEFGAAAYLVKPFSLDDLIVCVKTFSDMPAGAIGLGRAKGMSSVENELINFIESKGFTVKEFTNRDELSVVILNPASSQEDT